MSFEPKHSPKANFCMPFGCCLCVGEAARHEWPMDNGCMYHVKIGSNNLVYVNDIKILETFMEGLNGETFLNRPRGPCAIGEGILYGSGEQWKKNKRGFLRPLHSEAFEYEMQEALSVELCFLFDQLASCARRKETVQWTDKVLQISVMSLAKMLTGVDMDNIKDRRQDVLKIAKAITKCPLNNREADFKGQPKGRKLLLACFCCHVAPDIKSPIEELHIILRQWAQIMKDTPTLVLQPAESVTAPDPKCSENYLPAGTLKEKSSNESAGQHQTPSEDSYIGPSASQINARPYHGRERSLSIFSRMLGSDYDKRKTLATITESEWDFGSRISQSGLIMPMLKKIMQQPEFADNSSDEELIQSVTDLFLGGIEPTASAMEMVLFFLASNAAIQEETQAEVDKIMKAFFKSGNDLVTWEMNKHMNLVWACITETLRLGSIHPFSLPHVAKEDTQVLGCAIRGGSQVYGSIIGPHYDERHSVEPMSFWPWRHIDNSGLFHPPQLFKAFGLGARKCAGQKIAEMQLFLFTANILRHFRLFPTGKKKFDTPKVRMHNVRKMVNFRCRIEKRKVQRFLNTISNISSDLGTNGDANSYTFDEAHESSVDTTEQEYRGIYNTLPKKKYSGAKIKKAV